VAAIVSDGGLASPALTQDFQVTPPGGSATSSPSAGTSAGKNQGSQTLGWGSSIEVARQARAAQDALQKGDYGAAASFAEQAAHSAPQNTQLWWLLGYASRMAGRYQASLDAYQRGLRNQPGAVTGLSGLAQTYAKMGRINDATQTLKQVIEANPSDANALAMAGELLLDSDPANALTYLQRAEAVQASTHTELLIASAYRRLHQPEQSRHFVELARNRSPHDPDVLRAIAGEYRDSGQYELAISTLQSIPAKTPGILTELAYTYELAGDKQQAADLYAKLAARAKGDAGLDLSAAEAFVSLGRTDEAREFLEDARKLNPDHYRLHAISGEIATSEARLPDAAREYELALKNLPEGPPEGPMFAVQLRLVLYDLYQQNGDPANAKQQIQLASSELKQAGENGIASAEFYRLRAATEFASGDNDAADRDLKQALALAPNNLNSIINYASLLWKVGQRDAARSMYLKVLDQDARNRQALMSLGALARESGDFQAANEYFTQAAREHPKDFAPHLAIGDLLSSQGQYRTAEIQYQAAFRLKPDDAMIVAGGARAALEAHNLDLAKQWLDRAKGEMNNNAALMRERQRYLTWKGQYAEAADLGARVLRKLPNDTEGAVYRAYDLYYLDRYQEALQLATEYDSILSNNRDLALIAGYVHVRSGDLQDALKDFTRAVERDPKMATGFVNRGFVLNDLKQASRAVPDFQRAIELQPDYPEAHLGLGYAYLQLHRPAPALDELQIAAKSLGETHPWYLAEAEAFRQQRKYPEAEREYRAALQQVPNDVTTQLALGDTLYEMGRYDDAIQTLDTAVQLSPENPSLFALRAQAEAHLGRRDAVIQDVELAEKYSKGQSDVFMAAGEAFLTLRDRQAAMQYFARALQDPGPNAVEIRLAIAEIFAREGRDDDAKRQIGLAFAEARVNDAETVTPENYVQAADTLLSIHEFKLAEQYFERARAAGADQGSVAIGLANTYLSQGNSKKAEVELASLNITEYANNYDYLMAQGTLSQQRQDSVHALAAFAQASTVANRNDQQSVDREQYQAAAVEGRPINDKVSLFTDLSFAPALEDINVYTLDAKLLGITNPTDLPLPRHSFQYLGSEYYRVHLHAFPPITGFVGESMTRGTQYFPSAGVVQDRNTFDTMFNTGISPVLHLGDNAIVFNPGIQFTLRRDTASPTVVNQNLFRQYLYLSTSSFFNWVSVHGSAIHEAGPFTDQDLHSRDLSANVEFTVGRPWGKTALITGYSARDLLYRPQVREYFTTSTYVGLQRKFGERLTAAILGEYLRSWLVQFTQYSTAQALLPGARVDFRASSRWDVQASFLLSRGEGYHVYDNTQSEVLVSYVHPVRRSLEDGSGRTEVNYPFRFAVGVQQQSFYNFNGQNQRTILPIVRFTLF
jgi:tetratricopeptide (TPR) repeat protein